MKMVNARMTPALLAVLVAGLFAMTAWAADGLIQPVKATASSSQVGGPEKLIGDAGLSKEGDALVHTNDRWTGGGTMWCANYNFPSKGVNDYNAVLTFDLGAAKEVGSIVIWNYNEKDYTNRGVKQFELKSSADDKTYQDVGTFGLKEACGQKGEAGQTLPFKKNVTARYFRLKVLGNHSGNEIPGLSKVRFLKPGAAVAISEPPTAAKTGNIVAPIAATASSAQASDARKLIGENGLTETADGSNVFVHTNDRWANGGAMWCANYNYPKEGVNDYNAVLTFDMGKSLKLQGMHLWNYNEKGYTSRGVKDFEVFAGEAEDKLASIGTYRLSEATGVSDYSGQAVAFKEPVQARYFKLMIKSNQSGRDVPGLSKVRFILPGAAAKAVVTTGPRYPRPQHPKLALGQVMQGNQNIVFPADSGIVDVSKAPYNAKGDGVTDDTAAIQKALSQFPNAAKIIYLPNGTYKISDTLTWPKTADGNSEKNTILQGQSQDGTVIVLQDACGPFTNPRSPKAMAYTGAAPAQRFRNAVRSLTLDTGVGNRGAIGLQFNTSNQGTVREVTIVSGDGSGPIGLDMSYTGEIGPLLVKNVKIVGFDYGVRCSGGVNSMTFENLTLESQAKAGLRNDDQTVSIRKLTSRNDVPAVDNDGGLMTLIDSNLESISQGKDKPAIRNGASMFARNIKTMGYARAIESAADKKNTGVETANVTEWISHPATSLFDAPKTSLGLEIKETPEVPWDDLKDWVSPLQFGGVPNDDKDDSEAIQKAIDSGKTTLYLPNGHWWLSKTVLVRGNIRRIVGCEALLPVADIKDGPGLKVVDGTSPVVVIERLNGNYYPTTSIELASTRTLVLKHMANHNCHVTAKGQLFIEDVVSNPRQDWVFGPGSSVWARQFNPENQGTHITNDGANLWILGLKTERGGTLIQTKNQGKTEVLGGFSYTTMGGKEAPMFTIDNAQASITFREVCFNGEPFSTIIRESQNGEPKMLKEKDPAWKGVFTLYRSGK